MTNKYLEKIAKVKATVKNIDTTPDQTDLKAGQKGEGTLSDRNSLEKALESTTRPKSLREISTDSAKKSYKASSKNGKGDAAADAVKKMQDKASTPASSSFYTKQRLR